MTAQAIIFDLDGTLCDSRESAFWQFIELTREYDGQAANRETIAAAMHGTTESVVRALVKNTQVPLEEIVRRHAELRTESTKLLQLYPGVQELLPLLRRMGVQVAAVTAGNQYNVRYLHDAGVHEHFRTVVTADDVTNPKPHPEGLLLALERMGVAPEHAVMVGDTTADIHAGKRAGVIRTVAVTHGFGTLDELHAAEPDHIIHDIPSLLDVLE